MVADSLTVGFNPYASMYNNPYSTGLNNDFMYNASGLYAQGGQTTPADTLAFKGAPAADTFEKKSNRGTYLTLGGAVAAGGAGYHFLANPFEKENVFKNGLIKTAAEDARLTEAGKLLNARKVEYTKELYKTKGIGGAGVELSDDAAKIIEKLFGGETTLTKAEQDILRDAGFKGKKNFSPKKLEKFLAEEVAPVIERNSEADLKAIAEKVHKTSYQGLTATLENNKAAKALIEGLDDKAKVADIEKLIKENPKAFGITATEEARIAAEAKKLAKGKTKATFITHMDAEIANSKAAVDSARKSLNSKLLAHWDAEAKAFKSGAPEAFTKGLKNFKWKTAGKWAGIAAVAGLVLNWAFGDNKKAV